MKYRHKVSKRGSRKLFRKTSIKVHKRNLVRPNRGGLRM